MERSMKAGVVVILVAIVAVSTLLIGCDSTAEDIAAVETTEESDLYAAVSSDLNLTTKQSSRLRRMLARHDQRDPEPGFLWILADSLHGTLNARQLERLLNREHSPDDVQRRRHRLWDQESDDPAEFRRHLGRDGRVGGLFLRALTDLTDEQEQAIDQIRDEKRDQIEALAEQKRNGDVTQEEFREAMDEIRETTWAEIDAILTEEQKAELERAREERHAERELRQEEARQVRNRVLGLTDAEAAAFDAIVDGLIEAWRALREQARSGDLTKDQVRDQLRANREAADEELQDLLSDDQYEVVQIRRALAFRIGFGHRGHFRGRWGR